MKIRTLTIALTAATAALLLTAPASGSTPPRGSATTAAETFPPCAETSNFSPYDRSGLLKQTTALAFAPGPSTATTLQGFRLDGRSDNIPVGERLGVRTPTLLGGNGAQVLPDSTFVIDHGLPQRALNPGTQTIEVFYGGDNAHRACSQQEQVDYTAAPIKVTARLNDHSSEQTVHVGHRVRITATVSAIGITSPSTVYDLVVSREHNRQPIATAILIRKSDQQYYHYLGEPQQLLSNPSDRELPPYVATSWTPHRTGTYRIKGRYDAPLTSCCQQTLTHVLVVRVVR